MKGWVLRDVVDRIRGCFAVRRQRVFVLAGPDGIQRVSSKIPITIEAITQDNVHRVRDFRDEKLERALRGFVDHGDLGVFAVSDEKVVGHAILRTCSTQTCMVHDYFRICSGEALIHYCNVEEACRGQNIYPAMLAALCKVAFGEKNVKKVFIDTELENVAAVRGIQKVGFRPVGRYQYLLFRGRLVFRWRIRRAQET